MAAFPKTPRITVLLSVAFVLWSLVPAGAFGDFVITAFDNSRTVLSGTNFYSFLDRVNGTNSDVIGLLEDTGNFPGTGGLEPIQIPATEAGGLSDARGSALNGVDLLIVSRVRPLSDPTAAQQEYSAIAQFVKRGGCVVIEGDWSEQHRDQGSLWKEMANGILAAVDGDTGNAGRLGDGANSGDTIGLAGRFIEHADSQVLHGPEPNPVPHDPWFNYQKPGTADGDPFVAGSADLVSDAMLGVSLHYGLIGGAWTDFLAERQNGFGPWVPFVMEILPDVIPAESGYDHSGAVLIAGDTVFHDYFVLPNTWSPQIDTYATHNNGRLLMNFIAQQQTISDVEPIPEPATVTLLLIGALAAMGRLLFRRRRVR